MNRRGHLHIRMFAAAALLTLLVTASTAGDQMPQQPPEIGASQRAAIVDSVTASLIETYIFLDVAEEMNTYLRTRLREGAYDNLSTPVTFAQQLTQDLQSISHDLHLRVNAMPPPSAGRGEEPDTEEEQRRFEQLRRENFRFQKLEILPGNIGFMKFNNFIEASIAGATAVAAMNFLANVDALIIDLRDNGGGSPSMIQLLSSYFFEDPVHLNSFYIRHTDEWEQYWSQAHVQGPRMVGTPVFVLTSRRTFSAAEEFTYNLKNLERATIVGETTGGGAHPVTGRVFDFGDFAIGMSLPYGRAVNPITGTNWEGTGIEPHIQVPAEDALDAALLEAMKLLQEKQTDPMARMRLAWALRGLEVRLNPVTLTKSELRDYTGTYGPRKITLEEDGLYYQRDDGPRYQLVPMGEDTFMMEQIDYFRVRFERNERGEVIRIIGMYDDGSTDTHDRSR